MAETLTAPIEEKIQFVTKDEAEKFDKMMLKDWVKVDSTGKPLKSKEFIYRIIGTHPYEKAGQIMQTGKFLLQLEVQKFHRHKFVTKTVQIGGEQRKQKENMKVDQHLFNEEAGLWECVDEDANRYVDCRQFLKEFAQDAAQE